MNRRHRKGAIELSANFIVVIIISFVILVGGISIFFKLKASAQNYVDTVDKQTQDNIKSIMLSNNYRVAVYPRDLTLKSGDGEQVGIGITNIDDVAKDFAKLDDVTIGTKGESEFPLMPEMNRFCKKHEIPESVKVQGQESSQ